MPHYSREYAISQGLDKWMVDLADEFLYLNSNKKKAQQKTKTKSVYCDGFEITKIRITLPYKREVYMQGKWIAYEALKNL